jgi:(2R)-ethylmalonyl-CoA mutase
LSILSGSHLHLVPEVLSQLRKAGVDALVTVGGIIPPDDAAALKAQGVAAIYTPKDYELAEIMDDLVDLAQRRRSTT